MNTELKQLECGCLIEWPPHVAHDRRGSVARYEAMQEHRAACPRLQYLEEEIVSGSTILTFACGHEEIFQPRGGRGFLQQHPEHFAGELHREQQYETCRACRQHGLRTVREVHKHDCEEHHNIKLFATREEAEAFRLTLRDAENAEVVSVNDPEEYAIEQRNSRRVVDHENWTAIALCDHGHWQFRHGFTPDF